MGDSIQVIADLRRLFVDFSGRCAMIVYEDDIVSTPD
jgi:hypothetical protein